MFGPRRRRVLVGPLGAVLVLVALLAGMWLGGHPTALPGFVRDAFVDDDASRLVDEALDVISDDYYRPVGRRQLVDQSVTGMVSSLRDRFSNYFDPKTYRQFQQTTNGTFSGVGTNVQEDRRGLLVLSVFHGSPAQRAGIRAGDYVVAVDGRSIAGRPSAYSTALIKGRPGTTVRLTILHGSVRRTVEVRRAEVDVPAVSASVRRVGGRKVARVVLSTFSSGVHGELRRAVERVRKQGADAIVLDLRGNGGGLLDEAVLVSSVFLPKDDVVVTTKARRRGKRVYRATGDPIARTIPVVVLVDSGTASASEIVTAALRDAGRARVVGTRTFGKGVFQQVIELSNGGALDITVGEYFTPKGRNLGGGGVRRGAGITPDVIVRDRRATSADEALDRALAIAAGTRR